MNRSEPPRLARRLVEWALPQDLRESIVGDLDELFQARHREHGAARANVWYVRESIAFAARFAIVRLRERGVLRLDGAGRDLNAAFRRLRRRPASREWSSVMDSGSAPSAETARSSAAPSS